MNPLAIFAGPFGMFYKWGIIALLLAAFGAFCYVKGDIHGTAKLTEYQGQQAIATVKLTAARTIIVHDVETKYQTRIQTITTQGATITQEVPIYVTKTDDAEFPVPVGFVRLYGAAWAGASPGFASELDRQPSGVPLSEIAGDEANNATACLVYKEQRDGLIEFYRKLQISR